MLRSCDFTLKAMDGMSPEVFHRAEREENTHRSIAALKTTTADSKREQIERCSDRCLSLLGPFRQETMVVAWTKEEVVGKRSGHHQEMFRRGKSTELG